MTYYTAPKKYSDLILAKGTCWYCNSRLDDVRRFCNKGCAEAFEEDEMAMERRMQGNRHDMREAAAA